MSMEERIKLALERVKDFSSKLVVIAGEGIADLWGVPQVLMDLRSLVEACRALANRFGKAASEIMLYTLGYELGARGCRVLADRYDVEDPVDKLLMGPFIMQWVGLAGYVGFLKSNLVQADDFYLLWEAKSNYAEHFLASYGLSEQPTCFILAGYSAGWTSEAFGVPLATREVFCLAKGDTACRFLTAHSKKLFELIREDWVRAPAESFGVLRFRVSQ